MSFDTQIDGSVQDCSNSSALAMELPQSCTEPAKYYLPSATSGDNSTRMCNATRVHNSGHRHQLIAIRTLAMLSGSLNIIRERCVFLYYTITQSDKWEATTCNIRYILPTTHILATKYFNIHCRWKYITVCMTSFAWVVVVVLRKL